MTKGVFFRSSKQPMKKKLPPKLVFKSAVALYTYWNRILTPKGCLFNQFHGNVHYYTP